MIAHSLKGELFGPAQRLHGATYIVDVEFRRPTLDHNNIVVDIGRATEALHATLAAFNYRNLDDVEELSGCVTTTEFMARTIFDRLAEAIRIGRLGEDARNVEAIRVTLHESHVAAAAYEGPVREPRDG